MSFGTVDAVYLPVGENPDDGYEVPDAFTFDGKELKGIWVSKYEVTNPQIPSGLTLTGINGGFKVENIVYTGSDINNGVTKISNTTTASASDSTSGTVVITGGDLSSARTETFSVGGTITGLTAGDYHLKVTINRAYRNVSTVEGEAGTVHPITFEQDIYVSESVSVNEPDLSGFKTSTAYIYYVTYPNGITTDGVVGNRVVFSGDTYGYMNGTTFVAGGPSGWYDYDNKAYANIITSDTALTPGTTICKKGGKNSLPDSAEITMWVWIPRYQFKVENNSQTIWVSGTGSARGTGYAIPDAFNFGGKDLTGIWVGKYEIN